MSWKPEITFTAVGAVVRKFLPESGKIAFLTLEIAGERRAEKHEFRCFDRALIGDINSLGAGMTVRISGVVQSEVMKNKAREDVVVDGRPAWVDKLTIKRMDIEGSSKPASEPDDDNVPFA